MADNPTNIVREHLPYKFTKAELEEKGKELARESRNLQQYKDGKKSVVKEFDSKIASAEENIAKLSDHINTGEEYRSMDCSWEMDDPQKGKKTLYRTDNGEKVRTASMSDEDMQGKLQI